MRPHRLFWSVALAATATTLLANVPAHAGYAVPPPELSPKM